MADGKEERDEVKARLEEKKKKDIRRGERYDEEPLYEGQPEKGGS